jgi:uncharacterized SAM-binding protein YcdF (DUF218 family)
MRDLVEPLWLPLLVVVGVWVALWRKKQLSRWGAIVGTTALAALWFLSMPCGAYLFEQPLISESPPENGWSPDYIYVLSAGFELGDRPEDDSSGLETTRRVNRAVSIWQEFPTATLVMAGAQPGMGNLRPQNRQGLLMQAQAERLGVPPEAIVIDAISLNTNGHARVASEADFLQPTSPLIIVTSDFHLRRAQHEFSRFFDNIRMVGSDPEITDTTWRDIGVASLFPRIDALQDSSVYLREYVALMLSDFRN